MLGLQLTVGDSGPGVAMTLTDLAGNPVNLTGATVQFLLKHAVSGDTQVSASASKIQQDSQSSTWGQVLYAWNVTAGDTSTPGLFQAWFLVDFGNGPSHYPLGDNLYILIKPLPG